MSILNTNGTEGKKLCIFIYVIYMSRESLKKMVLLKLKKMANVLNTRAEIEAPFSSDKP